MTPLRAAALACILTAGAAAAEELVEFPYQWVEVADGVYAALQPEDNRFNDSNSVVIVSESDVIVVDTQIWAAFETTQPVKVLTYDGVPIVSVYARPD